MKNIKWIINLFTGLLLFVSYGQEGSLDFTFGDNGIKLFSVEGESTRGQKILVLDDNSIILGFIREIRMNGAIYNKGFYIYKLFNNGDIDNDFGQNGYLYFPNGDNGDSYIHSIAKQSDDKILLKCNIDGEPKLVRIYQDGNFDLTYGNNGIQSIDGGKEIALQSNDKVIVASQFFDGYNNLYKFLRYDTNGSLDLSFGDDGIIITDISDYRFDLNAAIKIQNDDKIIVVGRSYDYGAEFHPVITRFTENGFLDNTFGNNGTIIATFSTESELGEFNDIGLFNEQIIVGGNYHYSGGTGGFGGLKPAVIRFNMDGTYDNSYGNQGKVVLDTQYDANDYLRSIKVQSNGKVLLGGGASYPFPISQTNLFVIKLNYDGDLDSNFGNNGAFITSFNNSQTSYVTDLKLQDNGEILAFGVTKVNNNEFRNAIICRINNELLNTSNVKDFSKTSIYPNPTQNTLFVESQQQIENVKIYNLQGQLIIEGYTTRVDVSNLNAGLYFVQVEVDGKSLTKKFVKE